MNLLWYQYGNQTLSTFFAYQPSFRKKGRVKGSYEKVGYPIWVPDWAAFFHYYLTKISFIDLE